MGYNCNPWALKPFWGNFHTQFQKTQFFSPANINPSAHKKDPYSSSSSQRRPNPAALRCTKNLVESVQVT
ncbi:hypothetical protein H5410_016997 [Solanum commersonii]|uniref:Uncharacterized protein n=1 Tax=Solanum commersonii TaxID=4109 RepID=A0A9J5ZXV3_SOLCO|nr:hypothetical protein H5410_016997 [Solanum commersonii]